MGQNGCPLRAFAKTDNSQLDSEVTWDGIIEEFLRFLNGWDVLLATNH